MRSEYCEGVGDKTVEITRLTGRKNFVGIKLYILDNQMISMS